MPVSGIALVSIPTPADVADCGQRCASCGTGTSRRRKQSGLSRAAPTLGLGWVCEPTNAARPGNHRSSNLENGADAIDFEYRDDSSIYSGTGSAGGGEKVGQSEAFRHLLPGYYEASGAQPIARIPQLHWRCIRVAKMIIQSPDEVVAFLKAQHDLIEDMFDEVLHASDPQAREKPFIELRQLLAVHETAEEMVVHPRLRRELEAGAIVDALLQEEHDAKEQLSRIENIDITSQQFIDELTKLREAVLAHAEHEESEEFPKLRRELDADDLKRMGTAVRAAEAIAPTRPHAGVESAKLNFAVGPFASMLDRARDAIQQVIG